MRVKTNILIFCLQKIPSVTLGVLSVLEEIAQQEKIDYKFKQSIHVEPNDIVWADIIVAVRSTEELEKVIIQQAKKFNRHVIYFLDDDLLNVPKDSASSLYFEQPGIKENMKSIMGLADSLWTTNSNIQQKYKDYFKHSFVMNVPIKMTELKKNSKKVDDKVIIGFAGSIDHSSFINYLLGDIIKELIVKYGDLIQFEFFGCKPQFIENIKQIIYIPYENEYTSYKEAIASRQWDIGLAPLMNSEFHRCKYFNKYIEYGSLGVCGIYSDVEPLNFIIKHKSNGILVENIKEQWRDALVMLIEDTSLRMSIIKNSKEEIEAKFNSKTIAMELLEKCPQIVTFKADTIQQKQVKLMTQNGHHLQVIKRYIKKYKWKAPFIIGGKIVNKIITKSKNK